MFSNEFCEISKNTFVQKTSGGYFCRLACTWFFGKNFLGKHSKNLPNFSIFYHVYFPGNSLCFYHSYVSEFLLTSASTGKNKIRFTWCYESSIIDSTDPVLGDHLLGHSMPPCNSGMNFGAKNIIWHTVLYKDGHDWWGLATYWALSEDVHLILPTYIFSVQVKSGACYVTGQWVVCSE